MVQMRHSMLILQGVRPGASRQADQFISICTEEIGPRENRKGLLDPVSINKEIPRLKRRVDVNDREFCLTNFGQQRQREIHWLTSSPFDRQRPKTTTFDPAEKAVRAIFRTGRQNLWHQRESPIRMECVYRALPEQDSFTFIPLHKACEELASSRSVYQDQQWCCRQCWPSPGSNRISAPVDDSAASRPSACSARPRWRCARASVSGSEAREDGVSPSDRC